MKRPAGRFTVPQVDALRVLAMLGIFVHHLWGGRTGEGFIGASLTFFYSAESSYQHDAG